jgi:hypothetical protein
VSIVVGCVALAAPVPREARKASLYFPTIVGTEWVYAVGEDNEYTDTIVEAEESDGATVVTVVRFFRQKPMTTEKILVSPDGLFLLENGHGKHDPSACLLKLPHKPGDRWKSYSLPIKADPGFVNVAVKEERVRTPAGTFNAIRVDTEVTHDGKTERLYTHWYAPDVGVVKYASGPKFGEDDSDMVLKSFKLAKK